MFRFLVTILLAFGLLSHFAAPMNASQQIAIIGSRALRRTATLTTQPSYPIDSLKRKSSGVAVIQVEVDTDGLVRSAKVLEAPDSAIALSVYKAILKWRFDPPLSKQPLIVQGKLIFYFTIGSHNEPVVIDALDTLPNASYTGMNK